MVGDLPVGGRIPTTRELEAKFNTTNRTIQDALQILKDEGFIVGQRGQGVFVLTKQPHVVDVAAYFAPSPGGYSYDILDVAEVAPPADVAEVFGLPDGGVAVLRHRLTRFNGGPLETDRSYYPIEIARGTDLTQPRRIKGGAPRVLAEAGYPEREFVDRVSVRPPTAEEVTLLGLPASVPVMCQLRIVYSDEMRPVEVSLLVKPGNQYELRYRQAI